MISILVGQVPSSLSYFYGRFPSTRLRTGRTRLRISSSPLKSQPILPEWTLKWQLQHKAMVFPRLAIISLSAYPLPPKAFNLRTWCISNLPVTPHISHFRFQPINKACSVGMINYGRIINIFSYLRFFFLRNFRCKMSVASLLPYCPDIVQWINHLVYICRQIQEQSIQDCPQI